MKILVLGGTQFVGRVFLETLEKALPDADVSLFNRGQTNSDLFPQYKRIKGDRYTADILKVANEKWDVVVDFSCYHPSSLRQLLPAVEGKVKRYVFISTVSVYDHEKGAERAGEVKEGYPLMDYDTSMEEGPLFQHYGNKKAECERLLLANEHIDSVILRPSIIYGRYNIYERVYYWMYRMKERNIALIPGDEICGRSHTFVDDFAQMVLTAMIVKKHRKVYNATSFAPLPFKDLLEEIKDGLGSSLELVDIPLDYLKKEGEIVDRIPLFQTDDANCKYSNQQLVNDFSIILHSAKDSFRKTRAYYDDIPQSGEGNYGLRVGREVAILFGYFLDQDRFHDAAKLIATDCIYDIGTEKLIGPKAICGSYESNMLDGRKKFDHLEWGQSRIEDLEDGGYSVHFTDYLGHKGESYTHRCQQHLQVNEKGLISSITHINDAEESTRLRAYYDRVGL